MLTRIALILAAAAAWIGLAGGLYAPTAQGEAAPVAADRTADVPAGRVSAPSTQPDSVRADVPTTQVARGSQVSFLLTRNQPEYLKTRFHLLWQQASAEQRREWKATFTTIIRETGDRLEEFLLHKGEFQKLAPEVQDRYRERAKMIEEVIRGLSPSEQAKLASLKDPNERAKRILELAAELKARKAREELPGAPKP